MVASTDSRAAVAAPRPEAPGAEAGPLLGAPSAKSVAEVELLGAVAAPGARSKSAFHCHRSEYTQIPEIHPR